MKKKISRTQKRKKHNFAKSFYLVLLPLILGICIWQGWEAWSWLVSPASSAPGANKTVQIDIPAGTTNQQIGKDLAAAGLIRSDQAWKTWLFLMKLQNRPTNLKAGTYQLSPSDPLPTIFAKLMDGKIVLLTFTIPEGWSLKQMATYFESKGFFSGKDFLAEASKIPRDKYAWLPENIPHLEGFLYPDTYKVAKDNVHTPQQLIQVMLNRFEKVALPIYQQQADQNPNLSLLDWVTLSSIVEKEAVIAKERPLIAGVFIQRLAKKMRLESDPTVEYGLGIRQTADQPLTIRQVKTANPYNTYLNAGLPPTPIANPGMASLKATLNPEKTDYLFFVAKYDGSHVFSRTLREHNLAIRNIRQQRRK